MAAAVPAAAAAAWRAAWGPPRRLRRSPAQRAHSTCCSCGARGASRSSGCMRHRRVWRCRRLQSTLESRTRGPAPVRSGVFRFPGVRGVRDRVRTGLELALNKRTPFPCTPHVPQPAGRRGRAQQLTQYFPPSAPMNSAKHHLRARGQAQQRNVVKSGSSCSMQQRGLARAAECTHSGGLHSSGMHGMHNRPSAACTAQQVQRSAASREDDLGAAPAHAPPPGPLERLAHRLHPQLVAGRAAAPAGVAEDGLGDAVQHARAAHGLAAAVARVCGRRRGEGVGWGGCLRVGRWAVHRHEHTAAPWKRLGCCHSPHLPPSQRTPPVPSVVGAGGLGGLPERHGIEIQLQLGATDRDAAEALEVGGPQRLVARALLDDSAHPLQPEWGPGGRAGRLARRRACGMTQRGAAGRSVEQQGRGMVQWDAAGWRRRHPQRSPSSVQPCPWRSAGAPR